MEEEVAPVRRRRLGIVESFKERRRQAHPAYPAQG